jgi:hypothetical protein
MIATLATWGKGQKREKKKKKKPLTSTITKKILDRNYVEGKAMAITGVMNKMHQFIGPHCLYPEKLQNTMSTHEFVAPLIHKTSLEGGRDTMTSQTSMQS